MADFRSYGKLRSETLREGGSIQIGLSSLVLIFIVLCLVVFSTLSISSSQADMKLAQRGNQAMESYYKACERGEVFKKDVNRLVLDAAGGTATAPGISALGRGASREQALEKILSEGFRDYRAGTVTVSGRLLCCRIPCGSSQLLKVELEVSPLNQVKAGRENFSVKCWQVENKEDLAIDDDIEVWDGEVPEDN